MTGALSSHENVTHQTLVAFHRRAILRRIKTYPEVRQHVSFLFVFAIFKLVAVIS